jgi:hypothetical protein
MKKGFLSCVAIAILMVFLSVGSVFAADDAGKNFISSKVGIGYQGMIAGNLLNGASVRYWAGDRIGLEGNFFLGAVKATAGGSDAIDADIWSVEAKVMYAFIVRSNSKFYAGAKVGYGQFDFKLGDGTTTDIKGSDFWTPGVLVGAEWSFPTIPEVGFNFEVGYSGLIYNSSKLPANTDIDLRIHGVNAAIGLHYYF